MTTPPIVSITDELIAELEVFVSTPVMFAGTVRPIQDSIRALLAERAELKRRADQGDWLIEYMASERDDLDDTLMDGCLDNRPHALRSIIDAAMQAAQ